MNIYALDPFTNPAGTLGDAGPVAEPNAATWISSGACQQFLNLVETYTRLSNKTDKSKATRENAAKYAAGNQVYYNQCMERKAQADVQAMFQQQGVAPPTVTPASALPVTPTVVIPTGSSTSLAVPATPDQAVAGGSWFTANKMLLIGGSVLVAGVAIFILSRGRKGV